jgi:hypothetical protein
VTTKKTVWRIALPVLTIEDAQNVRKTGSQPMTKQDACKSMRTASQLLKTIRTMETSTLVQTAPLEHTGTMKKGSVETVKKI